MYVVNGHAEYTFKGTVLFSLNAAVYLLHKTGTPLLYYMVL